MHARGWVVGPLSLVALGLLLYAVACTSDAAPGGASNRSSGESPGSTVAAPPAPGPPIDFDGGNDLPPPNQGVVCDGGVAIGTGTIDQSQLLENGALFLTPTTGEPTQTFTAAASGYLTGVEFYVTRASVGTGAPVGTVNVELRTTGNVLLGTAKIPIADLPPGTERGTLSGGPTKGYFPIGSSCFQVTAGTTYRMKLLLDAVPNGVCNNPSGGDAGTCTVGRIGDGCAINTHCDYRIRVSMQNNGNPYDAGALSGFAASDLVFRTYVQP